MEDEDDDDLLWEVEKIIKKKKVGGEVKYLVKWVGWPESSNTWEPIEHLENAK